MKKEVHPQVHDVTIRCACGAVFESISTNEEITLAICSQCHPYFTGDMKFADTAGRIEKFERKFGKNGKQRKK